MTAKITSGPKTAKPANAAKRTPRIPTTKPRHPELAVRAVGLGDAARLLGIGLTATKKLIYSGAVRSVKVGDRRIVPLAAIDEFLAGNNT